MLLHFIKVIHSKQKKKKKTIITNDSTRLKFLFIYFFFLIKLGNALIVRATRVCKYTEIRFFFFYIPYTQHRRPFDSRFATTARQGQQHNEEYDLNVMVARRLRLNIII